MKYNYTIKELKQQGFNVFVEHFPEHKATRVLLSLQNKEGILYGQVYFGTALCGEKDQFNKKRGVKIALNRAVKAFVQNYLDVNKQINK